MAKLSRLMRKSSEAIMALFGEVHNIPQDKWFTLIDWIPDIGEPHRVDTELGTIYMVKLEVWAEGNPKKGLHVLVQFRSRLKENSPDSSETVAWVEKVEVRLKRERHMIFIRANYAEDGTRTVLKTDKLYKMWLESNL